MAYLDFMWPFRIQNAPLTIPWRYITLTRDDWSSPAAPGEPRGRWLFLLQVAHKLPDLVLYGHLQEKALTVARVQVSHECLSAT